MNKEEFMREMGKELDKISETERADILYDYEEHFMIGKENGKTEEEICLELGSPKEIANNYLLNHTNENIQDDTKEEKEKNSSLISGYNRRKVIFGSGVIIAVLLLFVASFGELARYNKSSISINGDKVDTGGISIDSNGVKVPGVSIDSNGVKVPGVCVDSNGVKAPGVSIDNNGVKVDLPGVNINIKN